MNKMPAFNVVTLFCLLLVLSGAAFTRVGYVVLCSDQAPQAPALHVQTTLPDDHIIANLVEDPTWYGGVSPLADEEELTAHVAPGYRMISFVAAHFFPDPDLVMRWTQCVLGILTVGCYFFFARRAFHSTLVATLAGLLAAAHPFWIINTVELNDGVLASFALALCLMLGARAGQQGGAFTSLLFGLVFAGLTLVRAAFLPFAVIALLWFLWQCRRFPLGWFAAILALLGFANGLAPWCVRNWQVYELPIPVASSAYWHLWMGNNPKANGSTLSEDVMRNELSSERLKALLAEPNQAKRYHMLAQDVWTEVGDNPLETLQRRVHAAIIYLCGHWIKDGHLVRMDEGETVVEPPWWITDNAELVLLASLVGMLVLGGLGWRMSYPWRRESRLAVIAVLFLPLPYILSHAEALAGPRLPLDGVLICFASYALLSMIPGLVPLPEAAPAEAPKEP